MQAQRSIITRPRRAAATKALQEIKRTARSEQRKPLPAAIDNVPEDINDEDVTTCPICNQAITPNQEVERCQACLAWVHHACVVPLVEQFDWTCRGLCGHPDVHLPRAACPIPTCGQPFRLTQPANEARWLAILNSRMWRRYARSIGMNLVLIQPPLARTSPWYTDRFRPRAEWWLARSNLVTNDPERRVVAPNSLANANNWNQPGQPKRLVMIAYNMFMAWTNPANAAGIGAFFRHQKFFVQPRLPFTEDHRAQRYIFTDLNTFMHGNRKGWKKMCKYYDDHSITVAHLRDM